MRRFLVVANQTLNSTQLLDALTSLVGAGPAHIHFLVPATPTKDQLTWTEGKARAIAAQRLAVAVTQDRWRDGPARIDGEVGDANPLLAVRDLLERGERFDLIVVSTLPPGLSRWLRQDLAKRIQRASGLPVHSVVATATTADSAS